jgi:hypothetical protein
MRKQPNYICMQKNLLKLYWIWTWDILWVLFLFCVVLFYFGFSSLFPLWWDNHRTTSEAPSPGVETEGWTPKLLRLKLYCILAWRFLFFIFFHLFIFYFYFIIIFIFIFIFNPLSVSVMPVQLTVDYYTISPCLYLWNFLLLCFVFSYLFICFSLFP